jgi:transcriptional regulator with XRE-family HTH domain
MYEMIAKRIAEIISTDLERPDNKQVALAGRLGISQPTLNKWKKGEVPTQFVDLRVLAEHFNYSADYLLGLTEDKNPHDKNFPHLGREVLEAMQLMTEEHREELHELARLLRSQSLTRQRQILQEFVHTLAIEGEVILESAAFDELFELVESWRINGDQRPVNEWFQRHFGFMPSNFFENLRKQIGMS